MLPVTDALPRLLAALDDAGAAVLTSPPGSGKTTLVPLALAPRKVVVAEPRRIAVRAAARRMAWSLGEKVGETVGYTIRGERQVSAKTRIEVVTTGVLLQRLQRDPELEGVDAVIVDECHERHLDADTTLAFLLDVRAALRPDLRILAMSATADAPRWASLIDGPVVEALGAVHPLDVVWAPPPKPAVIWPRVDGAFLSHVAATVRRAFDERDGDVLCFLPGVGELGAVGRQLGDLNVLQVHGGSSSQVQDAVLSPSAERRVILATSVAESSLTVPGVRIVVDSGLAREPRMDHARGLGSLVTVPASKAAATQRAGRAGREGPGVVYRCWQEAERRADHPQPEIALADLTSFALQAACWGAGRLSLLDQPPAGALKVARETLTLLGALDGEKVTPQGRRIAGIGVHPRLARALLDGAPVTGARRAAEIVALLSGQLPRDASDDLVTVWRATRTPEIRRETDRLMRDATAALPPEAPRGQADRAGSPSRGSSSARGPSSGSPTQAHTDDQAAGIVVALAYPERVARRRPGSGFVMASGTGAEVSQGSRLAEAEWLAVAVADRATGRAAARIRQAAVIDEGIALMSGPITEEDEIVWRDGDVVARRTRRLGAIELSSKALKNVDVSAAVKEGLRQEGLGLLNWTPAARALRERMEFAHKALGDPWPDVGKALVEALNLTKVRRRADLAAVDVATTLRGLIPWSVRIDQVVPERLEIPSGSQVRLDYSGDRPVLAARVQELFGWTGTPAVAGVPVTIHLLSPAGRPVAVTGDLASFWREGYRQVRAELRGRYPKHPWPEDPLSAPPTSRTNPRRR
ncbi:ATP-dependent helicase HrpB [Herbidospora mongoliensis]|uniref:ATP-dependent helicase HrpB n=1 Tax=Herbidospora mongoliensis TaxID=688067 RepID=UPI000AD7002A|nr:ATP-dependent helicase HrpB [Herbidospora mongoliensis]